MAEPVRSVTRYTGPRRGAPGRLEEMLMTTLLSSALSGSLLPPPPPRAIAGASDIRRTHVCERRGADLSSPNARSVIGPARTGPIVFAAVLSGMLLPWAQAIKTKTTNREMPPWGANPKEPSRCATT